MTKYVKLNAPVYGSSSYLRCESVYRKGEGYCIEIDPVEFNSGMVSMVFCKEHFALGDMTAEIEEEKGQNDED